MADPRFKRLRADPRFRRRKHIDPSSSADARFDLSVIGKRPGKQGRKDRSLFRVNRKLSNGKASGSEGSDEEEGSEYVDYARGEILLESSSEDESDDPIGESAAVSLHSSAASQSLAQTPGSAENSTQTRRLAVVNLDWDHIKASHLFKIFASVFLTSPNMNGANSSKPPPAGQVLSVTVYPSEFGLSRMREEDTLGPSKALLDLSTLSRQDAVEPTLQEENDVENNDALRQYQLDKLRYYYAIVDFDSVEAAAYACAELDGTELERTANIFDVSFVPADMSFDQELRDQATSDNVPSNASLKLSEFTTEALCHSKVKLTWDVDDPDRTVFTRRTLSRKEIEENDFSAFIASGSEDSGDEELLPVADNYKDKLRSILHENLDTDVWQDKLEEHADGEMEVTFTPGLHSTATKAESVTEGTSQMNAGKDRLSRKADRLKSKQKNRPHDDDSTDAQGPLNVNKPSERSKHKGKRSRTTKETDTIQDNFQIDIQDKRFAALYEDHQFAIDPSNPLFTETPSMSALLHERSGKQHLGEDGDLGTRDAKSGGLHGLIRSVQEKGNVSKGSKMKRRRVG